MSKKDSHSLNRRTFLQISAAATAGGNSLLKTAEASEKSEESQRIHRNERPSMTYRKLGRTNFMCSRLIFGCGAALMGGNAVGLLDVAFEAGINYFDTGRPYRDSEHHLAPFLKEHRDEVWITSKAANMGWPNQQIQPHQGKEAAKLYTGQLDKSLQALETDYIDCYMIMGIDDTGFVKNEELYNAFLKAKQAGKVGYYGISTHKNAQAVIEAAIETGCYDVIMPAITPAGWYDYQLKKLSENTKSLKDLQPVLQQAREAGIGLVAMKVAIMLGNEGNVFDSYYDESLKEAELTPQQKAYTYVLQHGLDVANSHMPNYKILQENLKAVQV